MLQKLLSDKDIDAFGVSFRPSAEPDSVQKEVLASVYTEIRTDLVTQRIANERRLTDALAKLSSLGRPVPKPIPGQTLAERADQLELATVENEGRAH